MISPSGSAQPIPLLVTWLLEKVMWGVVALHDQYIPALEKTFEINHVTFTELERLPTYAFLRRSHPLAKRDKVSMAELLQYPFVTYDQEADRSEYTEEVVFHQIAEKTVHVSDRCSKVALVRFTDAFSIGPDLTNSNADAFHSGMGEIVAMPVEEISTHSMSDICCKRMWRSQPPWQCFWTICGTIL